MPEISRFLGVVVAMFYDEHGAPHFHASYGEDRASVEIGAWAVRGQLPLRVLHCVLEWAELHERELLHNWHLARSRQPLNRIEPLE
jgi:hypothetical protein